MSGWGLSTEELQALRVILLDRIDAVDLFTKYSREVQLAGGGTWSHKAICPNLSHKQGNERSPSCYFSEKDKRFHCFGCGWTGDAFDLIGRMQGRSAEQIVEEFAEKEKIDSSSLQIAPKAPRLDLARINQKLSVMLRDHLAIFKDSPCYKDEAVWVDGCFRSIDERLAKLKPTDVVQARQMYEGVLMDLERRKSARVEECI